MAATRPTLPLLQAASNSTETSHADAPQGNLPCSEGSGGEGGDAGEGGDWEPQIHLLEGTAVAAANDDVAVASPRIKQEPVAAKAAASAGPPPPPPAHSKPRKYLPNVKKPPGPPQVVEEYPARLYFRGALCLEGDPYSPTDLMTHNLFHYTSQPYKDHIIRFDPVAYPVEGGLEGPGAIRLIRDVKNCYVENLNMNRGSPHLKDAQRRLFCLRGDIRKSSHIVQTRRCNVHLILRTDAVSHFMKCGKGCALHAGHARIVDFAKFRSLPDAVAPKEVAATGEVMDGYHPHQVVVVDPDHVPSADIHAAPDEIVSYPARIAFEGAPCLLDEGYDPSKLTMLELFSYTHPKLKHMIVRFDPVKYNPTEGGFEGEGWKALMADLKDKSEDPLCLHSVAVQDRDRLRRLCCRRGQMHHAKFVVQTCHCPVRLLIHKDDQTFFLKCGEGGSVHHGHPPLPKVYSQKGIPKRKYNPDGSISSSGEPGIAPASASAAPAAARVEEVPLTLPHSKTAKRLWPYVTKLVEALEGQPWQKVDAAGRQVQEITDEILQRKRERDSGRGDSNKSRKRQSTAAFSDDDNNNGNFTLQQPQMQQPQPQLQLQHQPLIPPPYGQAHHHQALYQPLQHQQNYNWL